MAYKQRIEKDELKLLRWLYARMHLTDEEVQYFLHLEKGFEGEKMFDALTDKLPEDQVVLNDLLLEVNNTKFQIDTTLIVQDKILLLEVKNYEGNYYYESDKLYTIYGKEINNPLDQLKRSESLFRQLLQRNGFRFPIESYVIFINPSFTLYQSPKNLPFVFPTQLNGFMKKLSSTSSKLNGMHKKLAEKLVSLHQVDSPYARIHHYEYDQLQKGILCKDCHSFLEAPLGKEFVCPNCGEHERLAGAVMRSAKELKLLFPDMKMTTNSVHEWCSVIDSKKKIRRILKEHFRLRGNKKYTYYEE